MCMFHSDFLAIVATRLHVVTSRERFEADNCLLALGVQLDICCSTHRVSCLAFELRENECKARELSASGSCAAQVTHLTGVPVSPTIDLFNFGTILSAYDLELRKRKNRLLPSFRQSHQPRCWLKRRCIPDRRACYVTVTC